MEKAIEIKRRAQRCILNGDLDGALAEYEKLAALENSDPYNYVLLADLTFKRGDHDKAAERYLQAADSYEKAGLYKNAIAVCKKMIRLKLSPPGVLKRLASLHALDGLATEAALYWMQYAEFLTQEQRYKEAAESLRQAFDTCPENVRALEKLAEVKILDGDNPGAARALAEAASHHKRAGATRDADRCRQRAEQLQRGAVSEFEDEAQHGPSLGDTKGHPVGPSGGGEEGVIGGTIEPPGATGAFERLSITDFKASAMTPGSRPGGGSRPGSSRAPSRRRRRSARPRSRRPPPSRSPRRGGPRGARRTASPTSRRCCARPSRSSGAGTAMRRAAR